MKSLEIPQKKKYVQTMFNNIAGTYDFLNHFLSLGIDYYWRWRAIRLLRPVKPNLVLDMATGTGDFAISAHKNLQTKIIGIDLAESMLKVGAKKITTKKLDSNISLLCGDAENIPVRSELFDAATVAFGVRNFENLTKGLSEINRTLKKGGHLIILEFSKPTKFPFKQLYFFYFKNILPLLGRLLSKSSEAYDYLPDSVVKFPEPNTLNTIILNAGYSSVTNQQLTFGIVTIHHAVK